LYIIGTLKLTTHGDREIVMTPVFDAPRSVVFDAFTKPELVKRWLLGLSAASPAAPSRRASRLIGP